MMGFIRKLMTLQKLFKILKSIDPKKLQGINDILEQGLSWYQERDREAC